MDYYKRRGYLFNRTNKRNYTTKVQSMSIDYGQGISASRQKTLRTYTLNFYKWLKRNNHPPFTFKYLYETVEPKNKYEQVFVRGYFDWLANRFGRV